MGRPVFKKGRVESGYKILKVIGKGGYGDIYYVEKVGTKDKYAMKIEFLSEKKQALAREHHFFKIVQSLEHAPRFYQYGKTDTYRFLIMECLGPSLANVRDKFSDCRLSLSTTLRVGIESLRSLQEFHRVGVLHRDIKPGNILVRPSRSVPIILIDYGLCRKYLDENNEPIPKRKKPGYVGTAKYASLNAHEGRELCQRDDLMSLFYTLIDLRTGKLPWRNCRDKQKTYEVKKKVDMVNFCRKLPKQFTSIYQLICSLKRTDPTPYDLVVSFLVQAMDENGCSWDDPYDWETLSPRELKSICPIDLTPPPDDKPNIPTNLPPPVLPGTEPEENSDDIALPDNQEQVEGGCAACNVY